MNQKTMEKKNLYKLVALLAAAAVIMMVPTNGSFTFEIKAYISLTVMCIGMVACSVFSSPLIPSLLLMFGYSLICGMDVAMSGWANQAPWSIISMFIIIKAIEKTPLFKRITFGIMHLLGGSYASICISIYLVGTVFSLLGSNVVPLILVMAFGVVSSLGYRGKKEAGGIMLCAYLGLAEASTFIYDPTVDPMLYGIASSIDPSVPSSSNYFEWFKNGAVFVPYYIILLVIVIIMFRPKTSCTSSKERKEYFKSSLSELGRMSKDEKYSSATLIALLLFLITNPLHNINMVYGFVGAAVLLYLPYIGVADGNDIKQVDYGFPIFIVACLGIGEAASSLGLPELLIETLTPYINESNLFIYFSTIYIIVFCLNFVMTPMAIYSALLAPLTAITMQIHDVLNVFPLLITTMLGVTNILLPHEVSNTMMLYSFNTIKMRDFVKFFAIKAVLAFAFLNIAVCYWKLIGLLL